MNRRSYLSLLSALPFIPSRLRRIAVPDVPEEPDIMWWFYFRGAIVRERVMSTERSRRKAVEECDLHYLSDKEARRILRLANDGAYEIEEVPDSYQKFFAKYEEYRS